MMKRKKKRSKQKRGTRPVIEAELNQLFSPEWLRKTAKETGLIKRERKIGGVMSLLPRPLC